MPIKCLQEDNTPLLAPEKANIKLFGPGVIAIVNANKHIAGTNSQFVDVIKPPYQLSIPLFLIKFKFVLILNPQLMRHGDNFSILLRAQILYR